MGAPNAIAQCTHIKRRAPPPQPSQDVFKFQSPLQKILLSLFGTFSSCRKAGALLSAPVAANATPLALRGGHGLRCFVFFFFFFFMLGGCSYYYYYIVLLRRGAACTVQE